MKLPEQLALAKLVDAAPEGAEWLHEQKFDGYRIAAVLERGRARLLSRTFRDWTAQFPTIAAAVAALPSKSALLDGEVAAVMSDGRTSFQALQNREGELAYFVFDLLALDGEDIAALPQEQRKARLAKLIERAHRPELRYSDHVVGHGGEFFRLACQRGLEGIVSKRRDAPYSPGRGGAWLKTKCLLRQELVIGGYTEPEGARAHLGALLVGYYEGGRLAYAGKVGTGFTAKSLAQLARELAPLATARSPFDPEPRRAWTGPHVHWVEPRLVAEVAFSEWTADGRLRHPSFQGMRRDKPAADVVRERAAHSSRRK